jgi:CBS domain-containing protein
MDVMVRDVITIGPEDTIADAAKLIAQNDVSALPVLDDEGQLVGIISEGNLMRLWTRAAGAPSLLSPRLPPYTVVEIGRQISI